MWEMIKLKIREYFLKYLVIKKVKILCFEENFEKEINIL